MGLRRTAVRTGAHGAPFGPPGPIGVGTGLMGGRRLGTHTPRALGSLPPVRAAPGPGRGRLGRPPAIQDLTKTSRVCKRFHEGNGPVKDDGGARARWTTAGAVGEVCGSPCERLHGPPAGSRRRCGSPTGLDSRHGALVRAGTGVLRSPKFPAGSWRTILVVKSGRVARTRRPDGENGTSPSAFSVASLDQAAIQVPASSCCCRPGA